MKEKIIIYGAGYCGLLLSDILDKCNKYEVVCFFDRSLEKIGKKFNNISIVSPKNSDYKNNEILIVVAILDKNATFDLIKGYMSELGYKNDMVHIFDFMKRIEMENSCNLIFNSDRRLLSDNKNLICKVYENLGDEISKKTYKNIMLQLAGESNIGIDSLPYKQQYFAYDIYVKNEIETVLDCGAFRGDILRRFIDNNSNKFNKYVAIEPDPLISSRILDERLKKDSRIVVLNSAISNKKEILYMKNYFNENSVVVPNGDIIVKADTLDNIINNNRIEPSFLKVDIEGYEEKLLFGGEKSIVKYNPLTAIAIYHSISDFWKIPLFFINRFSENKYYIRSYMNVNETIFYSVPKCRCRV